MTSPSALLSAAAGVVLAGGRSSRFGEDKAYAEFRGVSLLNHAIGALSALRAVAVSAKPDSTVARRARALGLPVIFDDVDAPDGPLSGVLAALAWAEAQDFRFLVIAPCDAPLLPTTLVQRLLAGCAEAPAAYATTLRGPQPLCAAWNVSTRPLLARALDCGRHPGARQFLTQIGAKAVQFDDPMAFTNVNTRADLAALERQP